LAKVQGSFVDKGFNYNVVTESLQAGCLHYTTLFVKIATDHITGPHGLCRGALHVQEFFFSRSLLSTDAYFMEQKAFPKEWVDMLAFLETVFSFSG
jgi:hypothetical protein